MRKKLLLVAVFTAVTAALVVGCKKESVSVSETKAVQQAAVDGRELLEKIDAFKRLRKEVDRGAKTEGVMSVEEMRDIIDLTVNNEISRHEELCVNKVLDTIVVDMPSVDGDGNVSYADAVAVYNTIENEIDSRMSSVDDGKDVPSLFSVTMPGEATDGGIALVFLRGSLDDDHTSDGPFMEGDDFKWGEMLGRCPYDPTERLTDAADQLTRKFRFQPDIEHEGQQHLVYNVEHATYSPCIIYDTIHIGYIYHVDNTVTCADTWLFCLSGEYEEEPCIDHDEMNCYWRSIRNNIVLASAPLHYGPKKHSPYYECTISAEHLYKPVSSNNINNNENSGEKRSVRVHFAGVTYCNVAWIESQLGGI